LNLYLELVWANLKAAMRLYWTVSWCIWACGGRWCRVLSASHESL